VPQTTHFIGKLEVFREQIDAAESIRKEFEANHRSVLIIAQPQQGKTATVAITINDFIKQCEKTGAKYEVIYLINQADNEIKKQSTSRFRKADLINDIKIMHHANLKDYSFDNDFDKKRLIIVDEGHMALGKGKPFHNFMNQFHIKYGQPYQTWENKNVFVLTVSATPYAQEVQNRISNQLDTECFTEVAVKVSEKYFSLKKLIESGRLQQSRGVISKKSKQVSAFFKDIVLPEFLRQCRTNGPGNLVVRVQGDGSVAILKEYLGKEHPEFDVIEFSTKNATPVAELDEHLSEDYPQPTIVIVRGALRAGKTLKTTKFIRGWVDSKSGNSDTVAQSVGRCLGFPSCEHDKKDDNFLIWCNIKAFKVAAKFYEVHDDRAKRLIPPGAWTKGSKNVMKLKETITYKEYLNRKKVEDPGDCVRISTNAAQCLAEAYMKNIVRSKNTPNIYFDDYFSFNNWQKENLNKKWDADRWPTISYHKSKNEELKEKFSGDKGKVKIFEEVEVQSLKKENMFEGEK